jgi:Fe-S cluster assembly protein SufD
MSAVAETTAAFSTAASRELGERVGDSPTVAALRAEAAQLAAHKPWPDSYAERPWKYHDVSRLELSAFAPAMDAVTNSAEAYRSCPVTGEHAAVIAFENSQAVFTEETPEGLDLLPLEGIEEGRLKSLVDAHLGSAVSDSVNKLAALHYAFLRGGALVATAPNTELKEPIRIVRRFISAGQFAAPHTLIVTGENSHITVVEEYFSGEGETLVLPAVEVIPGPGSSVRYTAVHRWGSNTRVYIEQRMIGARDAAFTGLELVTGGKVVKGHLESSLSGRGSSSELYGLFFGTDEQHIDFYTTQDHIGPDTRSDLLFKSALKDRARSVYYGMTRVGLEAKNADANQENRNLLLSETAKADSDPVLEILTSNVIRVSHGATAGPVDEEQLYYLQTRGIPYEDAEALLVRAFLGQVLDRVPDDAIRDELAQVLESKLER